MTTKIIRAQDILKRKGYTPPTFNTAGFQAAVASFFESSGVSARLTVFCLRFLDYEDTPQSGFHACTEYTAKTPDEFGISRDGKFFYDYPLPPFLRSRIGNLRSDEIGFPYILVDEPYVTNAVALLKMLGFVVSRKRRAFGVPCYTVTLV